MGGLEDKVMYISVWSCKLLAVVRVVAEVEVFCVSYLALLALDFTYNTGLQQMTPRSEIPFAWPLVTKISRVSSLWP